MKKTLSSTKKHLVLQLFLLLSFYGYSQTDRVVIGKIDSIESKILGEQRKVWVYVPDQEGLDVYGKQRYPVVYLLDGDAHFYSVVGMIQQLSSVNGNMLCPKMIVVGIPNTDRTRDLTPTHIDADPPFMDSTSAITSGGGENFIAFIEKELMPHIEAKYPTVPYKMLIGHSFGGLTVMQTFTHHTDLFNAYICIDPSMWWDHQKLLKQTQQALAAKKLEGKSLYLGIANTMDEGMDINNVQKDTSSETKHIRSILELQHAFEINRQNGLKYRSKYYAEDTHGSAPLITEYDALRFIFDFYPLKYSFKDFMDSTSAFADKYQNHFADISKKMGYKIKPDEMEINYWGYEALKSKYYKRAESFFKLNVDNYPESFNVYDSYADYFIAMGDKENAALQLKKALAIKENEGSRKKLEEMAGVIKVIPVNTPKGTFNVWTKRIGNNPSMKVLILHGGPGASHDAYECFESFLPKEGIEFIYYDQLACGYSDNPKDTSLYDLSRYVEEVEQVRKALNLDKNNFYLYGHSWGGILAMQYALKYQDNIKGLVISDMMASCPEYGKYANDVLAKQITNCM